jgi:hypothetical protein
MFVSAQAEVHRVKVDTENLLLVMTGEGNSEQVTVVSQQATWHQLRGLSTMMAV